jgi:hypothetical protein
MIVLDEGMEPVEMASVMACCKASAGYIYTGG